MLNIKIPTEANLEVKVSTGFKDKNPSNWIIQPEGDIIVANNSNSKESFEGTISEFNQRMKD